MKTKIGDLKPGDEFVTRVTRRSGYVDRKDHEAVYVIWSDGAESSVHERVLVDLKEVEA